MNDYSFYINPSEYEQAQANGISAKCLEGRIRKMGWGKQRAITQPVQKRRPFQKSSHWAKIAEQNGIEYHTFYHRVHAYGWTPERAATQPIVDLRKLMVELYEKQRKYPKKYYDLAKANKISKATFTNRMRQGWTLKMAATVPVMSRKEVASRGGMASAKKVLASRSREFDRRRILLGAGPGNG